MWRKIFQTNSKKPCVYKPCLLLLLIQSTNSGICQLQIEATDLVFTLTLYYSLPHISYFEQYQMILYICCCIGGKASGSLSSLVLSLKGPECHVGKSGLHVITTLLSLNIMLIQFPRRRKPGNQLAITTIYMVPLKVHCTLFSVTLSLLSNNLFAFWLMREP